MIIIGIEIAIWGDHIYLKTIFDTCELRNLHERKRLCKNNIFFFDDRYFYFPNRYIKRTGPNDG